MPPEPPQLQGLRHSGACKNPKMVPNDTYGNTFNLVRWEVNIQLFTQTAALCVGTDRATIKELYEQIYSHSVSILDVQALKPSCVFSSLV